MVTGVDRRAIPHVAIAERGPELFRDFVLLEQENEQISSRWINRMIEVVRITSWYSGQPSPEVGGQVDDGYAG
jgi:hypothetical protein